MKKYFILSFIIGIISFTFQPALAEGVPQISLSPTNGSVFEGGINGYGKTINISYSISNLESCWWQGEWDGFEIWILVDGNVVNYYRDPQRPAFFTYYGLTYSSSLNYYLSQGTHTIQVNAKSFEVKLNLYLDIDQSSTSNTIQIVPPPKITADNNFTDASGVTHGSITVSGHGTPTAPFTFEINSGQNISLTAISPQTDYQNYQRIWHTGATNTSDWTRNGQFAGNTQTKSFTVSQLDNLARYECRLRKICSVNFQNSFVGIGNGGLITVNGTSYNSPTSSFSVVELNPITALPRSGQIFNGIEYTFSNWNDGNTTANRTFNPSSTATYSAYYIGKPATYDPNTDWSMNLHHSTTIGEPIVLYWNEHPNTYVTRYQIWKKEKYNGVTSDPILMATVNRGTTSYVDDGFAYSLLKNKYMIYYTVVPYYSLENTYGVTSWMPVFAEILPKTSDSTFTLTMQYENTLSNYPNPFNPVTSIKFSIKQPGFVNIKVFDLIGQQVAELVNEEKQAGEYSIQFNAASLPSGIYFYTINSGAFTQTRKMLLMK